MDLLDARPTCGTTPPRGDSNGNPVTVQHSGLSQVWVGADAAKVFGAAARNGESPDVFGQVQEGIVHAKPTNLTEHGGMNPTIVMS